MYIVRNKRTKKLIHANPAPLSQNLKGKEIYYKFNPKTMEIGKSDGKLPKYFDINDNGEIVELHLIDMVDKGIIILKPYQKIENNAIVEKSVGELVEEGLLKLNE